MKKQMKWQKWFGVVVIVVGTVVVGLGDIYEGEKDDKAPDPILGDILTGREKSNKLVYVTFT